MTPAELTAYAEALLGPVLLLMLVWYGLRWFFGK